MYQEQLINEPITAKISINCAGSGGRQDTEFDRISSALQNICDDRHTEFIIYDRAHRLVPSWPTNPKQGTFVRRGANWGADAQIVLKLVQQPVQRVQFVYKLRRYGDTASLTCTFNPTTILAGNNVHPVTIAEPGRDQGCTYPSSHLWLLEEIYRLGFDMLQDLYQQATESKEPLFSRETSSAIRRGNFRVIWAQWCCYFPTPDVPEFLRVVGALIGHTIGHREGLIHLADHLGFIQKTWTDRNTGKVNGVLLQKRHGKKLLFSCSFYNKNKRVTDMKQGKSLMPDEVMTVDGHVRFEYTAQSTGIVEIVEAARQRLKFLRKRGFAFSDVDWIEDFRRGDIEHSAWWLQRASHILSHRLKGGEPVRKSFADWLVPHVIRDLLRFDTIAHFTQRDFREFLKVDDNVARAWRADRSAKDAGRAERLAKMAGCSVQTVYTRRAKWVKEYRIDIHVPRAFYIDLLVFGPVSQMSPKDRSDMLAARWVKNGAETLRLHEDADRKFDHQRIGIVGKAICSPLHTMEVKVARKTPPAFEKAATARRRPRTHQFDGGESPYQL
jgi:hypothetical protein